MGEPQLNGQIVYDSNQDYHQNSRLGSTTARTILRSPMHAKFAMENPAPATPAQAFGTAAHCALLEPDLFNKNIAVEPADINKRTKIGQMEYEAWLFENHGKCIITAQQARQVQGMMGALYRSKIVRELLASGHAEQSFYWQDPKTGVECKCRPDFLREGHILIDLKTCEDASFDAFQRKVTQYQYHFQGAWYLDGVGTVTDHPYDTFIIVAVEKSPPYGVAVYELDEATMEVGSILKRRALSIYSRCLETGYWPGYNQRIQPMNLTPWGYKEGDMHEFFVHAER